MRCSITYTSNALDLLVMITCAAVVTEDLTFQKFQWGPANTKMHCQWARN